jgi:WD40 repeat protein
MEVWSLAFTPDGGRLVSASTDKSIRVWDVRTGAPLKEIRGHTEGVNGVAVSPDGASVVSVSEDTTAKVWELATGIETARFVLNAGKALSVALSQDGSRFVVATLSGGARVFDTPAADVKGAALIEWAKQSAPRCLLDAQRAEHNLPAKQPGWCSARGKWPTGGVTAP